MLRGVLNVIEDRKKGDYRRLRQPLCAQQNKKTLEGQDISSLVPVTRFVFSMAGAALPGSS